MKKYLLSLFVLCICYSSSKGQTYRHIPDSNFRYYLANDLGCPFDLSGDSLDIADTSVTRQTTISCHSRSISNLAGIEYFTSLTYLHCGNNSLTNIPSLPSAITYFDCSGNSLASLPSLPSSLTFLYCNNNSLTSLPSLPSTLYIINCSFNSLTSLPSLPTSLDYLLCNNNALGSLPSPLPGLYTLECGSNSLTSLPSLPIFLHNLVCYQNTLTSLPSLPSSLSELSCQNNLLTSLPSLPSGLTSLGCNSNLLTSLPSLPSTITSLGCSGNILTSLPSLPSSLSLLECRNNLLTSLPSLPSNLTYLNCRNNSITILPSLPSTIYYLYCDSNSLTSLPSLPSSLLLLICSYNSLTTLPSFPSALYDIDCSYNSLTSLPSLPTNLRYLLCNNNSLTSLPNLPSSLNWINCSKNVALSCLPYLPGYLGRIDYDSTSITCLPNFPSLVRSYYFSPPIGTHPLCNSAVHSCPSFAAIIGTTYIDTDLDCINDVFDKKVNNMNILLKQGISIIRSTSSAYQGKYAFDSLSIGIYTTNIDTTNIPFSMSCPTLGYDSITIDSSHRIHSNRNFALQCKPGFDIGTTGLIRTDQIRPATPASFDLHAGDMAALYGVHCTNINGKISLAYSGSMHYTGAVPGTLAPDSILPSRLVWNIADFSLLDYNDAIKPNFFVDSSAIAGDLVCFTADITPNTGDRVSSNNTFSQCFEVRAAYDPNYKEVNPSGTITASLDWLYYTIHFQNLGNSYAENIYVWDTIDPNLNLNTIQVMGASHDQFMNVFNSNRSVRFNFLDIMLIDSTTNEAESKGWVQYRIKPNAGLAEGVQIQNTAAILFDLNAAIITNTVSNRICNTTSNRYLSYIINDGQSVSVGTHSYAASGYYTDIYSNFSGCDSTINTMIEVIECYDTLSRNITINQGESININGHLYNSSGLFLDTINFSNDCDSLIITYLIVNECYDTFTQTVSINQGESININGNIYSTAGQYIDSIDYSNDCDSIIITNLSVINGIVDLEVLKINIYPNPANHQVLIQIEGNPSEPLSIIDMYGRSVFASERISNKYLINTEAWSNGTYIIQCGSKRTKLVVSH